MVDHYGGSLVESFALPCFKVLAISKWLRHCIRKILVIALEPGLWHSLRRFPQKMQIFKIKSAKVLNFKFGSQTRLDCTTKTIGRQIGVANGNNRRSGDDLGLLEVSYFDGLNLI